ncbi:PREDICTED: lens fiber membrane intrinsic protein-like [Gekko japonicus]|uniref:Lens fiber membrane intrinsic protein-like n=1 Tax=Gekko japonicus TaxID=146911 RepID=A0ABM1KBP2_GEKJA|nr:PREDICTED: lens fiber membrane intrinsic protein-like [Gekko japonicus]XP_015271130.1 PREDICTED: lens fiber membrane intrinsic protein-like [Gekko japonicus]
MEGLRIATCFFSFVGLLLLITALASDYWTVDSIRSGHTGLWRVCDGNSCTSFGMRTLGFVHATRVFLLMGMVAGAVSFVGLCASFSHTHIRSISITDLAMKASFVAGVCSMIAMSIFTGVCNDAILSEQDMVWMVLWYWLGLVPSISYNWWACSQDSLWYSIEMNCTFGMLSGSQLLLLSSDPGNSFWKKQKDSTLTF